jgi:hypothetical protein
MRIFGPKRERGSDKLIIWSARLEPVDTSEGLSRGAPGSAITVIALCKALIIVDQGRFECLGRLK